MNNKLSPAERILLITVDKDIYDTYVCERHGVYQWNKNREYKGCIICFKHHNKINPEDILTKE